jgi:hypothetical protein
LFLAEEKEKFTSVNDKEKLRSFPNSFGELLFREKKGNNNFESFHPASCLFWSNWPKLRK